MTTTTSTKHRAHETASSAADETKHVAAEASHETQQVAAQAKDQARGLIDDAIGQVEQQSRTERDRLVGTLQKFSDDLEQMASQGGRTGLATDVTRQVAGRTRDLSRHLESREPRQLLDEARGFARRRPGVFLAGALVAGVAAGRLAKGAKSSEDGQGGPGSTGGMTGGAPVDPGMPTTGNLPPQREGDGRMP